jgi:hypothetical protein
MDADDPNEIIWFGFLRALGDVTMSTANPNPQLIGVHRRPSAVQEAALRKHRSAVSIAFTRGNNRRFGC